MSQQWTVVSQTLQSLILERASSLNARTCVIQSSNYTLLQHILTLRGERIHIIIEMCTVRVAAACLAAILLLLPAVAHSKQSNSKLTSTLLQTIDVFCDVMCVFWLICPLRSHLEIKSDHEGRNYQETTNDRSRLTNPARQVKLTTPMKNKIALLFPLPHSTVRQNNSQLCTKSLGNQLLISACKQSAILTTERQFRVVNRKV